MTRLLFELRPKKDSTAEAVLNEVEKVEGVAVALLHTEDITNYYLTRVTVLTHDFLETVDLLKVMGNLTNLPQIDNQAMGIKNVAKARISSSAQFLDLTGVRRRPTLEEEKTNRGIAGGVGGG